MGYNRFHSCRRALLAGIVLQRFYTLSILESVKRAQGLTAKIARVYARYKDSIDRAAAQTGLDPWLIATVIHHESGGNAQAVSHAGARGLMQIMPGTARGYGYSDPDRLFDPDLNIMLGSRYLAGQLKRFQNRLDWALAAYNAGPRNVIKYNGVPPFKETQRYVPAILNAYRLVASRPLPQPTPIDWSLFRLDNAVQPLTPNPRPIPNLPRRESQVPMAFPSPEALLRPPTSPILMGVLGLFPHEIVY